MIFRPKRILCISFILLKGVSICLALHVYLCWSAFTISSVLIRVYHELIEWKIFVWSIIQPFCLSTCLCFYLSVCLSSFLLGFSIIKSAKVITKIYRWVKAESGNTQSKVRYRISMTSEVIALSNATSFLVFSPFLCKF